VQKTTQTKKTTASGKGIKSGQAGTTAAKKQKSCPLTTADISDIVTAVVEALLPRADNMTARTQSSHRIRQRTTERQPDQATDETISRGTVTRRETRSCRRQTSLVREQQDTTDEEDSEDEDFW